MPPGVVFCSTSGGFFCYPFLLVWLIAYFFMCAAFNVAVNSGFTAAPKNEDVIFFVRGCCNKMSKNFHFMMELNNEVFI